MIHCFSGSESFLMVIPQKFVQEIKSFWSYKVFIITVHKAFPPLARMSEKEVRNLFNVCISLVLTCNTGLNQILQYLTLPFPHHRVFFFLHHKFLKSKNKDLSLNNFLMKNMINL